MRGKVRLRFDKGCGVLPCAAGMTARAIGWCAFEYATHMARLARSADMTPRQRKSSLCMAKGVCDSLPKQRVRGQSEQKYENAFRSKTEKVGPSFRHQEFHTSPSISAYSNE